MDFLFKKNHNIPLMLHVDTGMNRLGFQKSDIEKLKKVEKITAI